MIQPFEIAKETGIEPYKRYSETEAAEALGISETELATARKARRVGYVSLCEGHISYFGFQLLSFIAESIVPPSAEAVAPPPPAAQPTISPHSRISVCRSDNGASRCRPNQTL